jgi:hypothetical protein
VVPDARDQPHIIINAIEIKAIDRFFIGILLFLNAVTGEDQSRPSGVFEEGG